MSEYVVVFSVLLILLFTSCLGYYFPQFFIRLRGGRAVFSKYNKYDLFSSNKNLEFRNDVRKYKDRKVSEIIVVALLIIGLVILILVNEY